MSAMIAVMYRVKHKMEELSKAESTVSHIVDNMILAQRHRRLLVACSTGE